MLVANKLRPPLRKFGGQGCCEVPCRQVDHPLCITIRESHNIRQLYHDRSLDKFAPATSAETAPPGLLEFLAERVASSSRISGSIIPAPLQAGQNFCLSRAKPHSTRAYTARRNSETRDLLRVPCGCISCAYGCETWGLEQSNKWRQMPSIHHVFMKRNSK